MTIEDLSERLVVFLDLVSSDTPALIEQAGKTYRIDGLEYRDGAARLVMGEEDESWP
jgi:hypothetical protein